MQCVHFLDYVTIIIIRKAEETTRSDLSNFGVAGRTF